MNDFVSLFTKGDLVYNEHLVREMVRPLSEWRLKHCCFQYNRCNFKIDI